MDIQMPDLDGVQATKQIRALPPPKGDTTIIALTAHALSGARETYLAAGMNDYISKPVSADLLLSKLADLAERRPPPEPVASAEADAPWDGLAEAGIERASLDTLEKIMTPEETREFVEGFCVDAAQRLERMVGASDVAAVAAEAHALISIAGNVGAMRISKLAKSIDTACKAKDLDAVTVTLPTLSAAVEEAASALRGWLAAKPAQRPCDRRGGSP